MASVLLMLSPTVGSATALLALLLPVSLLPISLFWGYQRREGSSPQTRGFLTACCTHPAALHTLCSPPHAPWQTAFHTIPTTFLCFHNYHIYFLPFIETLLVSEVTLHISFLLSFTPQLASRFSLDTKCCWSHWWLPYMLNIMSTIYSLLSRLSVGFDIDSNPFDTLNAQ